MTVDVLDNPISIGLLQVIYISLKSEKGLTQEILQNRLLKGGDGAKESGENLKAPLELLENLEIISINERTKEISLKKCDILNEWDGNPKLFSLYLNLQLLSSIHISKNPKIHYFSRYLGNLFEQDFFTQTDFELAFKRARLDEHIDEEMHITGSGKLDHGKQFLKNLRMVQPLDGQKYFISLPRNLLQLAAELAVKSLLKSGKRDIVSIFEELLPEINEHYFPILANRGVLLSVPGHVFGKEKQLSNKFVYEQVPDGGQSIDIGGLAVNSVKVVDL